MDSTINCPKCGVPNPSAGKFCSSCGAGLVKTNKSKVLGIGCLGLIVLSVLISVATNRARNSSAPAAASPSAPSSGVSSDIRTTAPTPEPGSQWTYRTDQDGMGRQRSFASVTSDNTLSFAFPYQGSQNATLTIRRVSQLGTDVMVQIQRGQFLCGIEECAINIRFDSGPVQQFSASGPTDHSTTLLFINGAPRFISLLRKTKAVRVEATFYQEGRHVLEFNVEGLDWK